MAEQNTCVKGILPKKIGDAEGIAKQTVHLGNIALHDGRLDEAECHYKFSIRIAFKLKVAPKDALSIATGNLGVVYYERGNFKRAKKYFAKTAKLTSIREDMQGTARNLGNIANCYFELRDNESAGKFYTKAIEMAENAHDKREIAFWNGRFGDHLSRQGHDKEARKCWEVALRNWQEVGSPSEIKYYSDRLNSGTH